MSDSGGGAGSTVPGGGALAGLRGLAGFARSYAIYRARPWRARERVAFYRRFVKSGDLCFDIGAHVGNHTEAFLALGARVVAVEPHPQFAAFLRKEYGARDDVTVVQNALGARKAAMVTLKISTLAPTVSSVSADWIQEVQRSAGFSRVDWDRDVPVSMTTLDLLIAKHGLPAFCKIDVEGSEAEVLLGLSQALPQLCFEFVPAALPVALACLDRLGRLGDYRYNLVIGERPRFVLPDWTGAEALRARLQGLDPESRSGDVYARLASAA